MREKRIDSGKWGGPPWVAYLTGNLNFIAIGIGVILAVLLVIVLVIRPQGMFGQLQGRRQ